MPHLTPMSWIMAMIMIWVMVSMMNSLNWWKSPMKFLNSHKPKYVTNINNWKWL
nr:ATP synthase F0 subunit 8 [Nais communis]